MCFILIILQIPLFLSFKMHITWKVWYILTGFWLNMYSASFVSSVFSSLTTTIRRLPYRTTQRISQSVTKLRWNWIKVENRRELVGWVISERALFLLWIILLMLIKCENACLNNKNPSLNLSSMCDCLCVCPCITKRDREKKNVESRVSFGESLVFLHEYLIDTRSKIAWRETPKIKKRENWSRQNRAEGRAREDGREEKRK